jgi:DNA polymerase sigma
MTGLCLPSSDLDLVISGLKLHAQMAMHQLVAALRLQREWVTSVTAIDTAKVPVIKMITTFDKQEVIVDITFDTNDAKAIADSAIINTGSPSYTSPFAAGRTVNLSSKSSSNSNDIDISPKNPPRLSATAPMLTATQTYQNPTVETHNGVASVDLILTFISVFPCLRPLALIIKQLLYEHGLSNTYTGGLNSYCLILMIVAFLQSRQTTSPSPDYAYHYSLSNDGRDFTNNGYYASVVDEDDNLGQLLLDFLEFYGCSFDFQHTGIAISSPYTRTQQIVSNRFVALDRTYTTLVISDPFQTPFMNNIGKSVFAMWRIQGALEEALNALRASPSEWPNSPTLLSRILHGPHVSSISAANLHPIHALQLPNQLPR